MLIFLRRIPANTRMSDIIEFIEPALKRNGLNPFSKKGQIGEIKILVLKDNYLNALEYHGIVKIEPDLVAQRVIKQLNRKQFQGKHIAVRQYFYRSWHNDPRQKNKHEESNNKNRRRSNRRRSRLEVIEDISDQFSSDKSFHRRHSFGN